MTPRPQFVSLFSGAGGLDIGLEQAGFRCVYATDIDRHAVSTLEANRHRPVAEGVAFLSHAVIEHRDVRDLSGGRILAKIPGGQQIELLAGGPPCQAWSSAGRQRGFEDPRGRVAHEFIRLAAELSPRWILLENVRGLLTARDASGQPGSALTNLRESLLDVGYQSEVRLLNAADFGVPQRRVRLFVLGFQPGDAPDFPIPTHDAEPQFVGPARPRWRTLGSALEEIEELRDDEVIRPPERLAGQLNALPPGAGLKSPGKREQTRPGGHWGYTQGAFVADLTLPARTVTASSQQDWVKDTRLGLRRLAPRECAAIQTFPEGWLFPARAGVAYKLIGNAVPPLLAESFGGALVRSLARGSSLKQSVYQGLAPLPSALQSAIDYTAKEEARNGASRKSVVRRADDPQLAFRTW